MKHPSVLDADIKRYTHTPDDTAYSYLFDAMTRCVNRHRIEQNRLVQVASYEEHVSMRQSIWCRKDREPKADPIN